MIANFFQNLERLGVEYLLISGQATVLYGAATFSEDIDLWVNPTEKNRAQFLSALRESRACHYKLTPEFTVDNLQRGHGFHFVLPDDSGEVFLDVMGNPPRAGTFAVATATARWLDTEWGSVHTIGIKPLVELKKTQRLEDYPVIGKLALAWLEQPECFRTDDDFLWALHNIFTLPELIAFFTEHAMAGAVAEKFDRDVGEFGRQWLAGSDTDEAIERQVGGLFQHRMAELQLADRRYWRGIIGELKALRATGRLMPEGALVMAGI